MQVQLCRTFYLDAAHRVPGSDVGDCMHGHTFKIDVVVEGEVDPKVGWLIDFAEISDAFKPLHAQLDHAYLNEVKDMPDASLNGIRKWIMERLAPKLPRLKDVHVSLVGDGKFRIVELPAEPENGLGPRLGFTFEAAQALPQLPEGHKCRNLHGHSYRVEIGAGDLARLRGCVPQLYRILDRRLLNDIPGLEEATSERICKWVWDELRKEVDDLTVVVVQETPNTRCIYHGR